MAPSVSLQIQQRPLFLHQILPERFQYDPARSGQTFERHLAFESLRLEPGGPEFTLAPAPRLEEFRALAARERCPFAVVGEATAAQQLVVEDRLLGDDAVNMPLDILLGKPPKMLRDVTRLQPEFPRFDLTPIALDEAVARVLRMPVERCLSPVMN